MVKSNIGIIIILSSVILYGCRLIRENPQQLYSVYCKKKVPECFLGFQGMGKEVFPDFLSWGCFKYTASPACIKEVYLNDTLVTSEKDKKFEIEDCKYFPHDLSFYKEAINKGFISKEYNCENKIYIYGIKYPYVHNILYDTITHHVVHLVGAIRE